MTVDDGQFIIGGPFCLSLSGMKKYMIVLSILSF
jgi:hypothetical protein